MDEHRRIYGELFDKSRPSIETLAAAGLEIPYEIRVAAEVTLNDRLFREVERLSKEFKVIVEQGRIDRIMEEAEQFGYRLRRDESSIDPESDVESEDGYASKRHEKRVPGNHGGRGQEG